MSKNYGKYFDTFEGSVGFAADCYVEVEYQLSGLTERWTGLHSYSPDPLNIHDLGGTELDEDNCNEVLDELSDKVNDYRLLVEDLRALADAADDVLAGLEAAFEFAATKVDEVEAQD